jgi:hypothetical protein
VKRDGRKHYSMGTRRAVTIEAETDEPQTRARGEQFAMIVGDTLTEARALVEQRSMPGSPTLASISTPAKPTWPTGSMARSTIDVSEKYETW